jgi:NAD-dependent deacetylase
MTPFPYPPFLERTPRARSIVVLTGAGISVPSGLRPYRGPGGLWTSNPDLANQLVAGFDPATLWRVTCAWRKEVALAEPNDAHRALAAFEARVLSDGGSFTLLTQNVDGLHVRAGNQNVVELHGAVRRSRCSSTGCTSEGFVDDRREGPVPTCVACGAPVRPDIVLFEERLGALEEWTAKKALREVELFVAIGTSGTVSPASSFVRSAEYSGAHTVLVNLELPDPSESHFAEMHAGDAAVLVPKLFACRDRKD